MCIVWVLLLGSVHKLMCCSTCIIVFDAVHGPKLTEEVLSHCAFQKELSEMLDKPAILKHLKQQVSLIQGMICVTSL